MEAILSLRRELNIFILMYKTKDQKMYSRIQKKDVIGNRLSPEYYKEIYKTIRNNKNYADVQLYISDQNRPLKNKSINAFIELIRTIIKMLKNDKDLYADYLRSYFINYLEWLNIGIEATIQPQQKNIPTHIFYSKGYDLFLKLKSDLVESKTQKRDYSLIYWKMKNDKFIRDIRPSDFLRWLQDNDHVYNDTIDQLYSKNAAYSDKKNRLYSMIKSVIS